MLFNHILSGLGSAFLFSSLAQAKPISNHLAQRTDAVDCGQHGPQNRDCWFGEYNIKTDWEFKVPPNGKTRVYDLVIRNHTMWEGADGIQKHAMLINGTFPGPTIEADWGDFLQINVHNEMEDNGTSIHWHGLRQLGTNTQDGANGITECPIPAGQSKTYFFQVTQYGSTWYHSHFSAQYGNGVVGAMVFNGPASEDYDIDLGPYVISDYYYSTADDIHRRAEIASHGPPPPSDNILFNGTNVNPNGPGGKYARTTLQPGKKHRLRLINTSVDNGFTVKLQGHSFTVIANDLVPVHPSVRDSLFLAVGQRYDVIITADKNPGNYWFNATIDSTPLGGSGLCGTSKNLRPGAIFGYEGVPEMIPTDIGTNITRANCQDETGLEPVVRRVAPKEQFSFDNRVLDVTLDQPTLPNGTEKVFRWKIQGAGIKDPTDINIQWEKPTLAYVAEQNNTFDPHFNLIEVPEKDVWAWWIIENASPLPHPIHLHGHDVLLLGTGSGTFSANNTIDLDFDNPMRRDVVTLPRSGWLAIAYVTDNPGAWLMHCHIAWHVSMGLSVQFLERKDEIAKTVNLGDLEPNCANWREWEPTNFWRKSDSGL